MPLGPLERTRRAVLSPTSRGRACLSVGHKDWNRLSVEIGKAINGTLLGAAEVLGERIESGLQDAGSVLGEGIGSGLQGSALILGNRLIIIAIILALTWLYVTEKLTFGKIAPPTTTTEE